MPVRLCKLSEIEPPEDRIRQTLKKDQIEALAQDISTNGLYHPPVLRVNPEDESRFILVAGGRRLAALQHLHAQNIVYTCDGLSIDPTTGLCPFNLIKDLEPFQALEIELHENLLRVDLTWKETTAARARLHHLRTVQAEEKEKPRPTILDTAQELADLEQLTPVGAANALTRAVYVAPFLNDPEVAKAQSEAQAHRILMKKIEGEFYEKLQNLEEEKIQEFVEDQPVSWGHCLNADFTQLPLPENHFHLIIADPPYGISADQFGDAAQTSHTYSDTVETAEDFGYSILEKSYSLATASAHLFMFCDIELFLKLRYHAKHVGWEPFRTPLIWHHSGQGHVPWMPYSLNTFRREYDLILYCSKGDNGPTALTKLHSDIFQINKSKKQEHGAQKPDELYYQIMRLCCLPGNNVLDPCCGSGPVFPAAKRALLNPWGIEKNPDTYKLALVSHERAKEGVSP